MSITSELREFIEDKAWMANNYAKALAIADRIDAAHDQMCDFCERLERAVTNREDVTLWGVDYTTLPLDADGEPIHIGDVMEACYDYQLSSTPEVRAMRYGEGGWEVYDRLGDRYHPSSLRHHHAPTVEDVLREFGIDWEYESDCEDRAALLKEYAAKLRLAESEDA